MLMIDGSFGEGGGQILRTALSLGCLKGTPFKLYNIRKGRKRPGLMPQHLTCVNAIREITDAEVYGNEIGSMELTFIPKQLRSGDYIFDIKTAGSTSLVFQTLLPPLLFADAQSTITIKGGTHVPFSPPHHYVSEVFIPMLKRMGINVEASIERYGFYPKGGGCVRFIVSPVKEISGLNIINRGKLESVNGYSCVGRLPLSIAERQRNALLKGVEPLSPYIEVTDVQSGGEGSFLFLKAVYENTVAGFSSLGMKGKRAEDVGAEVAREFHDFEKTSACLDPHLADQLVLYLAISKKDSSFTTSSITRHLITNLHVIERFMTIKYQIDGDINREGMVTLRFGG
ncbi:MAG: RNA 3'-terminal phosphate cyclase [Thermodesulfovibrionia bacterium]